MATPSWHTTGTALAPQNEQALSGPIVLFILSSLVEPLLAHRAGGS
jgi:hypothetical protein